jgi:hypothetical protein
MHAHACVHACAHRSSTASLKGVRVFQCWGAMHVQQAFDVRSNSCQIHSYVHTLTHIQHFHSSTVLCKQPQEIHTLTEAMKVRQKCRLAGSTTGCWTKKESCIERRNRELGRELSSILRKANNNKINTHKHTYRQCTYVCMYDCLKSESASHSSPPQLKGVRVISACAHACVLTVGVHANKSGQTKNRYGHTH